MTDPISQAELAREKEVSLLKGQVHGLERAMDDALARIREI